MSFDAKFTGTTVTRYPTGDESGVWVCATSSTNWLNNSRVVDLPLPYEDRPPVTKGDRVLALPYTYSVREVVPISGTLRTRQEWTDPDPTGIAVCGSGPSVVTTKVKDIVYDVRNTALFPPTVPPDVLPFLEGMANTAALADLRRGFINAPLLFAERRETIALVAQKANILRELVHARQSKDLKRYFATRKKDKRRVARDISGEHLAMLFGVLPLISEAKGLCDLLAQESTAKLTGRGRRADEQTVDENLSSIPASVWDIGSGYTECYMAQRRIKTRYSVRTSISCEITARAAQRIRDMGFNPIATTFDLVPLSFLSDFISNLGTFLRSLDPLLGVTFKTGNTTLWEENIETLTVKGLSMSMSDGGYSGRISTVGDGIGHTRALRVTRKVLTDYPNPELFWANNMTWAKALTGVSLAIQRKLKPVRKLIAVRPFRYKGKRPKYLPPINYRKPI